MKPVDGVEINATDFNVQLLVDDDQNLVTVFKGTADMRVWATLKSFLKKVHEEAQRSKTRAVILDVRDLLFMNSSCFKNFVSWVVMLGELPSEQQYRVRILFDPNRHWQRRSLSALTTFADGLVTLEKIS